MQLLDSQQVIVMSKQQPYSKVNNLNFTAKNRHMIRPQTCPGQFVVGVEDPTGLPFSIRLCAYVHLLFQVVVQHLSIQYRCHLVSQLPAWVLCQIIGQQSGLSSDAAASSSSWPLRLLHILSQPVSPHQNTQYRQSTVRCI